MTFIASVVAKKGVAIIADSLVTTSKTIVEKETFMAYMRAKFEKQQEGAEMDFNDFGELFQDVPSHTKDYEEKLFKYDKYIAITTAGSAIINDKRISDLVAEAVAINSSKAHRKAYQSKKPETKVRDFCAFLTTQVKEHLGKYGTIGNTIFILSHYHKVRHQTSVYKIETTPATSKAMENPGFEYVKYTLQDPRYKVVCDGQNRISERILFGDRDILVKLIPKIMNSIAKNIPLENINDKFDKILEDADIFDADFVDNMKIFQLSNLSLQQAVDLACLLMRLEIDFQKYTRNIPTVGGVTKLAVIDDDGFRYIHGHQVVKPDVI